MFKYLMLFAFSILANSFGSNLTLKDSCIDITIRNMFVYALNNDPETSSFENRRELYNWLNQINIEKSIDTYISKPEIVRNPWFRMKTPHIQQRLLGLHEGMYFFAKLYGLEDKLGKNSEQWIDYTINLFSPKGQQKLKNINFQSRFIDDFAYYRHPTFKDRYFYNKPKESKASLRQRMLQKRPLDESDYTSLGDKFNNNKSLIKKSLCLKIAPQQSEICHESIDYIFKNLLDSGTSYNLANGWLADIIAPNTNGDNDPFADNAFKLTHKLLERIKNKDYNNASLITDAYEVFSDAKKTKRESEREAELFILLSFIHGQISWESYLVYGFIHEFNHLTINASYILSIAAAALDSLIQLESKRKYSYILPRNFYNTCDNGKPYHFLVPWFMAKQLMDKYKDENIAQKLPFIIDWSYQAFSHSLGRNSGENLESNYKSYANQGNRLDAIYAAMGADYGSHFDTTYKAQTNIDMQKAFDFSEREVPLFYRIGYSKWLPIITDNFVFQAIVNYNRMSYIDIFDSMDRAKTK